MRAVLASLLLCSLAAFAQSDRSTITGTISDPTGAVVANAPVVARNLDTGGEYSSSSTGTGNYTISELPVGTYELSVTLPGFKKFVRQGLSIQARQTYRIDIALEVGSATESVTVTEAASLLKTESGELSQNVTGAALNQLPVLGIGASFASNSGVRNPMSVTQLIPGGIYVGDNVVRLNGAPSNTQNLRIEGQDSTNTTWVNSVSQSQPSVDAIQEFSVQTSNYAAEFGKAGSAVFIVTMKSGNNQFHGSAYDYFVNDALNASTPFTNKKPTAHRNDYGATFGGPVWIPKIYDGHDKSFFFYNFEQFRERQNINNIFQTVPTAAYRVGDFTQALTGRALPAAVATDALGRSVAEGMIYDPLTQRPAPNGAIIRDPFPGNKIDSTRFDPVSVAIQKLAPLPSGPNANSVFQNYLPTFAAQRTTDINSIKFDQNISTLSKFSFYWSLTHTDSPVSIPLGADGFPDPITAARGNYNFVHQIRINYDKTLSPTLLLHVGVGFVDQNGPFSYTPSRDNFDAASIGLKGVFKTLRFPRLTGMMNTSVNNGGLSSLGQTTVGGSPENPKAGIKSWRPGGNISLTSIRGNHTVKIGGEVLVGNYSYPSQANAAGRFNFSPNETSLPSLIGANTGGAVVGFPYASFLLGAVDNGTIGFPTNQHFNEKAYALFIQDSWKVTRKLTLDYGLRWDFQTYLHEQYGRMPSFSAYTLNPTVGRLGATIFDGSLPGRCNCDFASNYPYAIGPRLGVAYQITPKTVARAGFGVVYAKTAAYDNLTIAGGDSPFSSPGLYQPVLYLKDGAPAPQPWPNFDPGQYPNVAGQIGTAPNAIDPNAGRPARQLQWSISLQREINRDLVVEVSYIGNRGAWWRSEALQTYNAIRPSDLAARGIDINNSTDQALLRSTIGSAAAISRGITKPYATFPSSATVAQALRPFPQFGNITPLWSPLGSTWYNSLQVKVTKRLSHGLDASYSFTWQKSLSMGAENESTVITGGVGTPVNDVFNRQNNKYLSGYDQPLSSQIAINYALPKWGPNALFRYIVSDWTIGTFLQYRSGMPIQAPAASSSLSTYLFQNTFFNRVPDQPLFLQDLNCHCFDPNKTFVLNPKAWANPAVGQFGTAAAYYTDYRYQRRPVENMSFGRIFRIKEKVNFSIRAEFTNIFNRTQMANPVSTNAALSQTFNSAGAATSGFGFINTGSTFSLPRQGTIIGRIQF